MKTDHEQLKPCPFCGGDVQLETVKSRAGTLYGVVCRNTTNRGCTCAMEQVPSRSAEAAIARWNMRKPEDELRAQLAQAQDENKRLKRGFYQEVTDADLKKISDYVSDPGLPKGAFLRQDAYDLANFTEHMCREVQATRGKLDELGALRKDAERYRWLSQVSTMAEQLAPDTIDAAIALHQAIAGKDIPGDEIPDFTPGNGNKARRRAEELGIDYDAAMTNEAGKAPDAP